MTTTPNDRVARPSRTASRSRRLAAAVAAGPLAVLLTAAAAAAAPAASDADTANAAAAANGQVDILPAIDWETVTVNSGGAKISFDGNPELFRTGAVKGGLDLGLPAGGDHALADNLFLHKVKGSPGDFGDVGVMIGPDIPVEGAKCTPDPVIEFASGVFFDVAKLPVDIEGAESGGDPIPLATDPFVLEPVVTEGAESFPPVNQVYKLEDSVSLYLEAGDGEFEKVGVLEGFTVTVNRDN